MDTEVWVRAFFALGLVLALLGGLAVLLRWLGPRLGLSPAALPGAAGKTRLSVSAQMLLDARHRAVVLKADGTEHLVILGGASPVVVAPLPSSGQKES